MFEKEILVVAAFDKKEAVLQQRIHFAGIVAEESEARPGDGGVLHLAPDAA